MLITTLFTLLLFSVTSAQTKDGAYLNFDYLKVSSENMDDFEGIADTQWKEIFKKEMGDNKITGCYVYRVLYPGGQLPDYNYVIVRTYSNIPSILEVNERLRNQMDSKYDKLRKKTLGIATHQFSELWKTEAGIFLDHTEKPSEFMVMNYMQVMPGRELEYLALENDIARPLHQERVEEGMMHNWRTYALMKPGGMNYKYNFATADYYDKIENIEFGFTNDIMKTVMPNANVTETLDAINQTRVISSTELWQLIVYLEE